MTHGTISSAIFAANFPTLVPPYFCTIHEAAGSMLFWCRFGGVCNPVDDTFEDDDAVVERPRLERVGDDSRDEYVDILRRDEVQKRRGNVPRICEADLEIAKRP